MSLEQQLKQLNENKNDDIANWAADAYDLQADLKAGKISKEEYTELLGDLEHSKAITEAAGDLAAKTEMYNIIQGLKALASLI
jgi:hypothetical protein